MLDNGATYYLTIDVDHFEYDVPYLGQDGVIIVNVRKLRIEK